MKKFIFLVIFSTFFCGLALAQEPGLSLKNFRYEEGGITYYVIPQGNAEQIDLKGRRYLEQKEALQIAKNQITTYQDIMVFVNKRLDDINYNYGQSENNLRTLTYNYNTVLIDLQRTEEKVDVLKKEIRSLKLQRGIGIGAVVATIVLVILVQ